MTHVTTSAELTQFDGRARGDDVMGNLTVSKLRASQVTVGISAYVTLQLMCDSCVRPLVNRRCSFVYDINLINAKGPDWLRHL